MTLSEQYPYRTELHAHSSPASSCSIFKTASLVKAYDECGIDTLVLTNHLSPYMPCFGDKEKSMELYFKDYDLAVKTAKNRQITVILGCELRFTDLNNDYLLYGASREELASYYDWIDRGIEAFSEQFRREDHLLLQAHPFRDDMVRVDPALLDGIETFNMNPDHNSRVALAARYAKEHDMIVTAGTDSHKPGQEGLAGIRTKERIADSAMLVRILKSRDYLFEIGGCLVDSYDTAIVL